MVVFNLPYFLDHPITLAPIRYFSPRTFFLGVFFYLKWSFEFFPTIYYYIRNMEIEIYKDIPGYEGLYQVSNMGNVKSLNYNHTGKEKLMKPGINTNGYYRVTLHNGKNKTTKKVHQLVAMAFLGHKPDGTHKVVVNHIDNNPLNNHVDNLEITTQRINTMIHKIDVGVSLHKKTNKWRAQLIINKKNVHLGCFTDKQECLNIYQKAVANIHLYDGNNKNFRTMLS